MTQLTKQMPPLDLICWIT